MCSLLQSLSSRRGIINPAMGGFQIRSRCLRVASGFSRKDVAAGEFAQARAPHASFRLKPEATLSFGDQERPPTNKPL
jgi:hypothetical protein